MKRWFLSKLCMFGITFNKPSKMTDMTVTFTWKTISSPIYSAKTCCWFYTRVSQYLLTHQVSLLYRSVIKGDQPGGGRHSTFFQVGVCGPDFWSVGLAKWYLPLKRGACELKISKVGGLWTENFQIWGLVSWKFPNLEACELNFWWKLRL